LRIGRKNFTRKLHSYRCRSKKERHKYKYWRA